MKMFDPVDWHAVFVPSMPLLEIVIRGTLVYAALFVLLRFFGKRQSGAMSMTDLLVVVLVADAAQNAMAGDYKSVPDGVLLVATLVFWSFMLDWLGARFPAVERLLHPPPLPLVRDGRLLIHNLRRELISRDELMTQIREQGIDDLVRVRAAFMEGDGRISVIAYEEEHHSGPRPPAG